MTEAENAYHMISVVNAELDATRKREFQLLYDFKTAAARFCVEPTDQMRDALLLSASTFGAAHEAVVTLEEALAKFTKIAYQ
jgi:hypothetical protein